MLGALPLAPYFKLLNTIRTEARETRQAIRDMAAAVAKIQAKLGIDADGPQGWG